jgi:heat-inducible transcriptional repressor
VARVEVYPRAERHVLLVLILDSARVRTGLVQLEETWPTTVLREAARTVDRRARGLTVAEVRGGGLEIPDLVRSPTTRCAVELARACRQVLGDVTDGDVELEGVAKVLEEPEFHDPEPLKALLRFVESPRLIRASLARLDRQHDQDLDVWIGGENPVNALRPFSVVTRGFAQDGRRGVLAVLGPRRMAYQRAFHGIDLLGRALEESTGRLVG